MLEFFVKMVPVPKGRPRLSRFGGVFTPKKTRDAEQIIRISIKQQYKGIPLMGPLSVTVIFYLPKPKNCKRLYPTVKPDCDNLAKTVLDSCNKILWDDDSQIVHIEASKHYVSGGGEPGFVLTLDQM